MNEEIKCTNCGGDKFKLVGDNIFKCAYCGTTVMANSEPTISQPPQYAVPQPPQYAAPQPSQYAAPQPPQYAAPQQQPREMKNKTTAALLALFLGAFGAHKFYLRQTGVGIIYLIFFWAYIPGIIAFIEFIIFLTMSQEEFDRKYNTIK